MSLKVLINDVFSLYLRTNIQLPGNQRLVIINLKTNWYENKILLLTLFNIPCLWRDRIL